MNEPDPAENPFTGLPFLGDMARAFASQGPIHWEMARQFAIMGADDGNPNQNVDPTARIAIENLTSIAAMHVDQVTLLASQPPQIECVTKAQWAHYTLESYKPLFDELASALSQPVTGTEPDTESDPMASMMAGLSKMMAPSMMGMAIGSMIGQLSQLAFGQYDLPLPRDNTKILIVPSTIDAFADEWSLEHDDARLWTLLHELSMHAFFSASHIRDAVWTAVHNHVRGFQPDPTSALTKITEMELDPSATDPMALIQKMLSDPEVLLGASTTSAQQANRPLLDTLIALAVGYTDFTVDECATRLLGTSTPISEAIRRRRLESSPADIYVEHLLGLRLQRSHVEKGRNFVSGVVERAGRDGFNRMFESPNLIPTVNEIEAPGLWLARIEIND